VYIPVKEYPDYNFIGLIIGPRGITQKTMEKETGAKIAIRGKGSVKDGRGKNSKFEDENDELHVLITSESEEAVIKAEGMVRKLLVPVEEGQNVHKRDQLRKLAELNGTLRDNMLWGPNPRNWSTPDVYCKYCGEISHPSSDCPNKKAPAANVDQEYLNFMASIEGGGEAAKQDASVEASYLDFMAALSGGKPGEGQPPQQQQPGGYQHDQYNPAQQQQPWGQQQQLPPQPSGGAPWQQQQHYGQQQQAPWQQPQQQGYGQWNNGYSGGGGGGGGGW
jgi:splicing factor 1